MSDLSLNLKLTVEQTMKQWPGTVSVFLHYRTACVGCPMSPYDTLQDVISNYHLNAEEFLQRLLDAITKESHEP